MMSIIVLLCLCVLRCQEAASRPQREHKPKRVISFVHSDNSEAADNHLDMKGNDTVLGLFIAVDSISVNAICM